MKENDERFLRMAIELARRGVAEGGGPFGAVIVKDGQIIAEAYNKVTLNSDATAHAEIEALRKAGAKLGSPHLKGCVLYSSTEPCPMCLSALYWAHIDRLCYASSRNDAEAAGFDDAFIYDELSRTPTTRRLQTEHLAISEARAVFDDWLAKQDRISY